MLGGSCSPCCGGCTQAKVDELNAQLRSMTVKCALSQQSYVPQSGVLRANTVAQSGIKWQGPSDTTPATLNEARALISSTIFSNMQGDVRLHEEQVSSEPYELFLDASENTPVFKYNDSHIEIFFACQFHPALGVELPNETTGCRLIWNLNVYKLRRQSSNFAVKVKDILTADTVETTYGPEFLADNATNPTWGDTTAAAVAQYLPWDYETADGGNYDTSKPFGGRNISTGGLKTLSSSYQFDGQYSTSKPGFYFNANLDYGTGTAARSSDGGAISLMLDERTRSNNSFAFHARSTTDTQLEPLLVTSPSYSHTRLSIGTVRFKQAGTTSQTTYSYVGTSYTASAVVTLTPSL